MARRARRQERVLRPRDPSCPTSLQRHELKTKPTQHSVKELQSLGIQPDFLVLRSDHEISAKLREKIAMFCDVEFDHVFACEDAPSIYEIPRSLFDQGFDVEVLDRLGLKQCNADMSSWNEYLAKKDAAHGECDIAIVGKYTDLPDAYLSVIEALHHAVWRLIAT